MSQESDEPATTPTRRTVLQGVAGAIGTATVGTAAATAHEGHSGVTTTAAINSTAPSFGQNDYVGLFVQIVGEADTAETKGVRNCEFVGANEGIAAFDVQFLQLTGEDKRQQEGRVFTAATNETVSPGQLYAINNQTSCGSAHYQVQLEQVGASKIKAAEKDDSSFAAPGFGPLAALAGLGLGAAGLARRSDDQ